MNGIALHPLWRIPFGRVNKKEFRNVWHLLGKNGELLLVETPIEDENDTVVSKMKCVGNPFGETREQSWCWYKPIQRVSGENCKFGRDPIQMG